MTPMNDAKKPWNICDDFLDPLAELLCTSGGDDGPLYLEEGKHKYRYQADLRNAIRNGGLAATWLEVNVSVDVADRLRKRVSDAIRRVEAAGKAHVDVSDTGVYLKNLALVLRQRDGQAIGKADIPADKWGGDYSAAELEKLYDLTWRTIKKRIHDGTIRGKMVSRKPVVVRLHMDEERQLEKNGEKQG